MEVLLFLLTNLHGTSLETAQCQVQQRPVQTNELALPQGVGPLHFFAVGYHMHQMGRQVSIDHHIS